MNRLLSTIWECANALSDGSVATCPQMGATTLTSMRPQNRQSRQHTIINSTASYLNNAITLSRTHFSAYFGPSIVCCAAFDRHYRNPQNETTSDRCVAQP
eukprot:Selendium_serpulae@DN4340_c5_g1_i2.p2